MNKGNWHGKQLLPAPYIDALMQPQAEDSMGLLWWIAPQYRHFATDPAAFAMLRERGVPEPTVTALEKGLPAGALRRTAKISEILWRA